MAAQLINNPWSFVAADSSATPASINRFCVVQVEYVGYASATDAAEVQDQLGNTIAFLQGKADLSTVRTGRIGWVNGILVPANTFLSVQNAPTGKVLIYFE